MLGVVRIRREEYLFMAKQVMEQTYGIFIFMAMLLPQIACVSAMIQSGRLAVNASQRTGSMASVISASFGKESVIFVLSDKTCFGVSSSGSRNASQET